MEVSSILVARKNVVGLGCPYKTIETPFFIEIANIVSTYRAIRYTSTNFLGLNKI